MNDRVSGQRVEVVLIYQSLLGLYGDRGNATVLIKRLAWRGYEPIPDTSISWVAGRTLLRSRPYGPSRPTVDCSARLTAEPPFSRCVPATRL
jgi:hypothetical protein